MRGFDRSLTQKTLTVFGGLVTDVDRVHLSENLSPANQNVIYGRGTVGSRYGSSALTTLGAGRQVNGMFTYTTLNGTYHLMAFAGGDSSGGAALGTLYYENPANTFNVVSNTMGYVTGSVGGQSSGFVMMSGDSHYGRAWMAFHDGFFGVSHPRKYDGTTLSRIGTERPGWTGTTAIVGGTGAFTTGTHRVRISFETDAGFTTPPSKVGLFDTSGVAATTVQLTNLPLGPTGTVRRVVWVATVTDSAATDPTGFAGTTQNYYTLRNTNWIIPNNTSTSWTIDGFTDAQISLGESALADRIWTIAPIPPVSGMVFYKNRYFYYGALGTIQPEYVSATAMDNYAFESGPAGGTPYGWTPGVAGGALTAGVAGATGNVWRMTGSGAASVGAITQSAVGVHPYSMFTPGINYGVRVRVKKNATLAAGTLRISSTINSVTTNFDTPAADMLQSWLTYASATAVVTGQTNSGDPGPNPIKIELISTPTSGGICDLDWIDFFDILRPNEGSRVYCSSVDQPETVDSETGFIDVSPNDGQIIHSAFVLRDNLYFVKDRSIYVTSDNGATEPAGWSVSRVDDNVGTASVQGVGIGEGWVVIAARSGLYYFDGGLPQKLSQEIQPTWDLINWPSSSGYVVKGLDVKVDVEAKRIYVVACTGVDTDCNTTLVLDYQEGILTDPTKSNGVGRKWTIWGLTGNSVCLAERGSTGRRILLFGDNWLSGGSGGIILKYDTSTRNDSGQGTAAYYETAALGSTETGVSYFGGAVAWVGGVGTFTLFKKIPVGTQTTVGTVTLANPPPVQVPFLQNDACEGLTYKFYTSGADAWWIVSRFTAYMKPHMWYPLRG